MYRASAFCRHLSGIPTKNQTNENGSQYNSLYWASQKITNRWKIRVCTICFLDIPTTSQVIKMGASTIFFISHPIKKFKTHEKESQHNLPYWAMGIPTTSQANKMRARTLCFARYSHKITNKRKWDPAHLLK